MLAVGYIQIKANRDSGGRISGLTPTRLTLNPPSKVEPDSIVVKVEFAVRGGVFEPYLAQATVPDGVKAIPVTVTDPNEEEEPDDGS